MQKDLAERNSPLSLQPALKKEGFFETSFTDKGRKKFQVFSRKIWWLKNESYLRRPFNKNGSSCKSSERGLTKFSSIYFI